MMMLQAPGRRAVVVTTWLDSLDVGTWYEVSGASPDLSLSATNDPNDVDPDPGGTAVYDGVEGFDAIWDAWNSAVYASSLGSLGSLLHYGGGHAAYYGNTIVRFDISSRTWILLQSPSTAGPFEADAALTNGAYTDDTPSPPHTYRYIQFDAPTNSMVCLKAISHINAPNTGTSSLALPWMYSLSTNTWRRGPQSGDISAPSDGMACYDTTRNCLWMIDQSNGDCARFDPDVDNGNGTYGTWTFSAAPGTYGVGSGMAHDPVEDLFVVADFTNTTIYTKDPASMTSARGTVTQSGAPTLTTKSAWEYSSILGGIVYHRSGTGDVYLFSTADGWANGSWSTLTSDTNGKTFTQTNGIYDKSRVVQYNGKAFLIYSRSSTAPVLAMRLA